MLLFTLLLFLLLAVIVSYYSWGMIESDRHILAVLLWFCTMFTAFAGLINGENVAEKSMCATLMFIGLGMFVYMFRQRF